MTRIHPFLASLLAAALAAGCSDTSGDTSNATGFNLTTESATTTGSTGEPSTATGAVDTGTSAAPTTGAGSTGDASSTDAIGETVDASTGGDTTGSTGGDTTGGDTTGDAGTTADPDGTSTGNQIPDDGGDTIYEIQQGIIAEGVAVSVKGVIVTAVAPDLSGLFAQEPDGGEYSGIWVAVDGGPDIAKIVVGDVIDVTGTTIELAGRTTIDAGSVTPTGIKGLVVAPTPLPSAVFSKPVLAEPWESVLIRISGAPLSVAGLLGGGEFKLVDNGVALIVDDFLFNVPANMVAFPGFGGGATFTQSTGVLNADGEFNVYKLAPRRPDDLAGYQKP